MSEINKELAAKAAELGIKAEDFDDEKKLEAEIATKVKEKDDKEKDNNSDPEFWKSEAKAAFEERDKAKKERRALQSKLTDLEKKINEAPNQEVLGQLQKELKDLKKFKEEVDSAKEEEELKQKSEVEKVEIRMKKQLTEWQDRVQKTQEEFEKKLKEREEALSEKDSVISSLRKFRLKNEIMEEARKLNAYEPTQIVGLTSHKFTYDPTLDKFVSHIKDDKGKIADEKSVTEVIKEFLSDPLNDNLVKSDVNTQGFRTKPGSSSDRSSEFGPSSTKKKYDKYDPKNPELIEEAEFNNMTVDELIQVKKLKDEKLAKIKSLRK